MKLRVQSGSSDQFARIVVLAQVAQFGQQPLNRFFPDTVNGHDQVAHLAHVRVVIDVVFDCLVRFSDLFFDVAQHRVDRGFNLLIGHIQTIALHSIHPLEIIQAAHQGFELAILQRLRRPQRKPFILFAGEVSDQFGIAFIGFDPT
ncbi:hypothetical protein PS870_06564 [Pseudomonas fluorescens]|uniref:Uncharacterized protein n=1 Tax=Pseudomonas fluorescens TaxID=294 RepID=A0A5E7QKM7_PSEFL|nr:hypothetical protein PS870_06564 [Pseudomonas fluorescens]